MAAILVSLLMFLLYALVVFVITYVVKMFLSWIGCPTPFDMIIILIIGLILLIGILQRTGFM